MRKLLTLIIVVVSAAPAWAQNPVAIVLGSRHAHATPQRCGCARTAGGNIHVSQPTPDTVVITMSGGVAATGHPFKLSQATMNFDLKQEFKVVFADPTNLKPAKLHVETQVVGLLRSGKECSHNNEGGSADHAQACASISSGPAPLVSVCVPPHAVACGDKQSINCQEGPASVPVAPGCYTLNGAFAIQASHAASILPCRAATAEFAPGALDPVWFGHKDAFHGASKTGFGFRITLRVVAD